MTEPRDFDSEPTPDIKIEQEVNPPQRYDDPEVVAEEEKRFGLAIPIMVALITIIFIIALVWVA